MTKRILDVSALNGVERRAFARTDAPSFLSLSKDDETSSAELLIYGEIGGWWDGVSAEETIKELSALDVDTINVRLNSPGGGVFDGVAIYNALAQHSAEVVVHVEGVAASIASVIAMAGDTIKIGEAANFMIHKPWSIAIGSATDMRKEADILDVLEAGLIDVYVARTGAERADLEKWVEDETWFRGQAAVDAGFADEVVPAKKKKKDGAARSAIYARFRNAPADLCAASDNIPAARELEKLLAAVDGLSNAQAKRIAASAAKIFAPEREVPANTHRDDAPQQTADASLWRLTAHLRKLAHGASQ